MEPTTDASTGGTILGGTIGSIGAAVGTYGSLRVVKSPAKRRAVIRWTLLLATVSDIFSYKVRQS